MGLKIYIYGKIKSKVKDIFILNGSGMGIRLSDGHYGHYGNWYTQIVDNGDYHRHTRKSEMNFPNLLKFPQLYP